MFWILANSTSPTCRNGEKVRTNYIFRLLFFSWAAFFFLCLFLSNFELTLNVFDLKGFVSPLEELLNLFSCPGKWYRAYLVEYWSRGIICQEIPQAKQ